MFKIIDVSQWQGDINWSKVKADGIDFAIIRMGYRGYGSSGTLNTDPYFHTNMKNAIAAAIREKDDNLVGSMASQGTTPRRLTDLIGSLCDLTSGSGDKGTPIILIQGYFDNFTTN